MTVNEILDMLYGTLHTTGIYNFQWNVIIMWGIGSLFIYLAIAKKYEPLLLLPIGFGIFIVNFPLVPLMGESHGHPQLLMFFYRYGLQWEVIPCIIFLGLGAMTDFGPLIANPKTLLIGAGAQLGVFITFTGTVLVGFTLKEAASVSIIGGADGPTTIYLTQHLAPQLLGANALAAYSYMAMVPLIQPPIMRLLTNVKERKIRMRQMRPVSRQEKILFPLVTAGIVALLVPSVIPLMGMFMLGNLMKESGVVARLTDSAQGSLMNIVTIFLGVSVGATMQADKFLSWKPLFIFSLGLVDFAVCTVGGIVTVKIMNLFLKEKINPLIGSAGVSAVPMAARVSQMQGLRYDKTNHLLMHAMGPNLAGVIGSAAAAGMFIAMFD
ncbi:MAG: sodium ion-translocating decarboxylase subunit beta [Proteobacteria bacterium]|nr:sodium ion-translocating decarboxylase subunit beta [Desulfobacterales bacterium]MBL6968553.1 sodium ion-translocating decarboxylase subunit beta [Desulfobacteraceae bacterium]MBU0735833.1 sodium ion-translocating decarboxylase subunit beta [Pseudomonadota bacterium]MBL7102528.1 sodium ion-translocating decarboxylase subunit beta [Desulfobacteraceae bacterium]MBL7172415.1 sodium ion-translocating decarboxylase subunit beta [Desulfobacteraceae bacterium]